jgi:hypothetical protein
MNDAAPNQPPKTLIVLVHACPASMGSRLSLIGRIPPAKSRQTPGIDTLAVTEIPANRWGGSIELKKL